MVNVIKVKGHALLRDIMEGRGNAVHRLANNMADAAAKRGTAAHPHDEAATARVHRTTSLVQVVAKFLARF